MNYKKLTLKSNGFPEILRHIPNPPQQVYIAGKSFESLIRRPRVAMVGSRQMTVYGELVTTSLASRLAERGIVIVSGLAFGVDYTALKAALDAGSPVIAVLPGPLDNIVPIYNRPLAERILLEGGALLSEYPSGQPPQKQNFIARNRLMAGLAEAVLVTEAGEKSGALYTARFALEQGKEVLAVPGRIDHTQSAGCNHLLKSGEAATVTSYKDVLHALKLEESTAPVLPSKGRTRHEQILLDLMSQGISGGEVLLEKSGLPVQEYNQALTMLEISGKVRALGSNNWAMI